MIDFDVKTNCYHCGACAQVCPVSIIKMVTGEDGFLYPQIDVDKCVNCNMCNKVCPAISSKMNAPALNTRKCFAAVSLDREERINSASGAVFYEVAKLVVEQNGFVAGCIWDYENKKAKHILTNDMQDVARMRSSKYVWSDTTAIFSEVSSQLKQGKSVLFSGTPCQVAAIKNYCGNCDRLLTLTLFCHGNASPTVLKQYINEITRENEKVEKINLRFHGTDEQEDDVAIHFSTGRFLHELKHENLYLRGFFDNIYGSLSCLDGTCRFKGDNLFGDILCGDYWQYSGMLSPPHISAVICTTSGEFIINELQKLGRLFVEDAKIEKISVANGYLYHGCSPAQNRAAFFNEFNLNGFHKAYKKYGSLSLLKKIVYKSHILLLMKHLKKKR